MSFFVASGDTFTNAGVSTAAGLTAVTDVLPQRFDFSHEQRKQVTGCLNNPGRREIFRNPSRPALRPTQPLIQWVPSLLPGGKADGVWR